jgi:gliding motility-associated-like protein
VAQCLESETKKVGYEIVHYPNIITPNKDGKNETYIIDGIEGTGDWSFEVHDRWGKEIYRNENYDNSWSGDYLSDGTYYYLIIAPDGTRCKGWVQLVK